MWGSHSVCDAHDFADSLKIIKYNFVDLILVLSPTRQEENSGSPDLADIISNAPFCQEPGISMDVSHGGMEDVVKLPSYIVSSFPYNVDDLPCTLQGWLP